MRTPTAAEHDGLDQLLDEAFSSPRIRPAPERRSQLDVALRMEIRRLIPVVQAQADRISRGTRAWYSRDKTLAEARDELKQGLSPSSLAACLRLTALARVVCALDDFAGGEP
ncbi:hypothetical protein G3I40_01380 [Streptomyces sp. SID14478]|uniref:DUF6415 family natural product biosynthesis protein n=1 Tax=Streptomyces sp. SID14478 TaxID=2706073 RepID=UPI0013D914BA|nr:DUF6415 family natural product biosynthesis protein [Streptomyces sp. SID14478]NEB73897.1 hypothetical protein [Streptomyces sp. SID14478]